MPVSQHSNQAALEKGGGRCVFWGHIESKFVFKFHSVYLRSRLINITYSHMLGAPQVEKAKDVKLHRTSIACCSYPMAYKTLSPFLYVPVNSWNIHIVKKINAVGLKVPIHHYLPSGKINGNKCKKPHQTNHATTFLFFGCEHCGL